MVGGLSGCLAWTGEWGPALWRGARGVLNRGTPWMKEEVMLDWLLRARRVRGDVNAIRQGPRAVARRGAQRGLHRLVNRLFR